MLRSDILSTLCLYTMLIYLQVADAAAGDDGHCIWYGECYHDAFGHGKNCPYEGPAKELDMQGQEIFSRYCQHMIPTNGDIPKTCCDTKQLMTLDKNIRMASSILKRCPSCMSNFEKQICEFTCSPQQSLFVNVTEFEKDEDSSTLFRLSIEHKYIYKIYGRGILYMDGFVCVAFADVTYVNGIQVYFTPTYLNGTYKSCSRVSMPSSGELALDLMCGEYGSTRCNPQRWFSYMGDSSNPFVPFEIAYVASETPVGKFVPRNPEVTPCNKALNVSVN